MSASEGSFYASDASDEEHSNCSQEAEVAEMKGGKSAMPRTISDGIKKRDREIADLKEQLQKAKSQKMSAPPKTPMMAVLGAPKTPSPNVAESQASAERIRSILVKSLGAQMVYKPSLKNPDKGAKLTAEFPDVHEEVAKRILGQEAFKKFTAKSKIVKYALSPALY